MFNFSRYELISSEHECISNQLSNTLYSYNYEEIKRVLPTFKNKYFINKNSRITVIFLVIKHLLLA